MLKKISEIELSKISGGAGSTCHCCQRRFHNHERILCIHPIYKVYDATTGDFIEMVQAGQLSVCLNPNCKNWFEIFRRSEFSINNKIYAPVPDQEEAFYLVYEE